MAIDSEITKFYYNRFWDLSNRFRTHNFIRQDPPKWYTTAGSNTEALTHTTFYKQRLLHTDALHTDASTHRTFCTQKLLHTEAFTHRGFYSQTLLHTGAFTHRRFYTQKLLHTQNLLHTDQRTLTENTGFGRRACRRHLIKGGKSRTNTSCLIIFVFLAPLRVCGWRNLNLCWAYHSATHPQQEEWGIHRHTEIPAANVIIQGMQMVAAIASLLAGSAGATGASNDIATDIYHRSSISSNTGRLSSYFDIIRCHQQSVIVSFVCKTSKNPKKARVAWAPVVTPPAPGLWLKTGTVPTIPRHRTCSQKQRPSWKPWRGQWHWPRNSPWHTPMPWPCYGRWPARCQRGWGNWYQTGPKNPRGQRPQSAQSKRQKCPLRVGCHRTAGRPLEFQLRQWFVHSGAFHDIQSVWPKHPQSCLQCCSQRLLLLFPQQPECWLANPPSHKTWRRGDCCPWHSMESCQRHPAWSSHRRLEYARNWAQCTVLCGLRHNPSLWQNHPTDEEALSRTLPSQEPQWRRPHPLRQTENAIREYFLRRGLPRFQQWAKSRTCQPAERSAHAQRFCHVCCHW